MTDPVFSNNLTLLHENEVIMLLLGVGIFIFLLLNRKQIRRIFKWKTLVTSYFLLLSGWTFTILEGFFLQDFLNFMEHFCYVSSSMILATWCLQLLRKNLPEEQP